MLLSLERFRKLVGINPAHFWGAKGETYFPDTNDCSDIFYEHYWQSQDNVSRDEIKTAIIEAEDEIARAVGYYPAPKWIEDEVKVYPRHHRRDVYQYGMGDNRGMNKALPITWGKFIQGGRRATSEVESDVTVTYSDEDGDGFDETATITTATSLTDACEIKCYIAGNGGNPDYEIKQPRTVTISGGNVTFTFWSWQLLKPTLQDFIPTPSGTSNVIDIESAASFQSTVDVYREYNDFTQVSAQLFWERIPVLLSGLNIVGFCCDNCGGVGCKACEFVTQDGCIHVKNGNGNYVVPVPATYDSDNAQWDTQTPTVCRDPDLVKMWYYAGDLSQKYLSGLTCDRLSDWWAKTIAWLAVSKVNRPFCTCNNSLALLDELQRDASFTGSRIEGSFTISPADLDNPFGTRIGAIRAWKRVSRMTDAMGVGVAV